MGIASLHPSYESRIRRRDLAARCARSFAFRCPSLRMRAQGRPGARCTRGLACNVHQEMRTRAYRFSGEHPAFPAQWLYGLYEFAPVTGFLATVICESFGLPRNLTPTPGRQAHTTSPYARGHTRLCGLRVHRIPSRVCDDRETPSEWNGTKVVYC